MLTRLLLILLAVIGCAPAVAQPRTNAIQPELVAETRAVPGREVELAIIMHTRPGWHGYWQNPGDAGLPMQVDWQLPAGASVGEIRYPVPTRLTIAGLMNYVYERDYALLVRLKVPPDTRGPLPISAKARWLACTDEVCVPEQGEFALRLPVGSPGSSDPRFAEWRRALPQPLTTPAKYVFQGGKLLVAVPLPADVAVRDPYLFPITSKVVDYGKAQTFRRPGDWLVAELDVREPPGQSFEGVVAIGPGRGLQFRALPDAVPSGGTLVGVVDMRAAWLAILGALAGGLLLNLMPCVFPILALKVAHLSRAGGSAPEARRDGLAYAAGAVLGTGALGLLLLAIRAGGTSVGWAFQLQDPRTILLLLLLATAITINLLGLFELPVLGGRAKPAGSFGTGALAAFVATPCAGPFLGASLGAALLLPPLASVLIFAALGLGLAIPFLLLAFLPGLRGRMPKPGPWMRRFQRFLAIPMGATVAACLWLLSRQASDFSLFVAVGAALVVTILLVGWGVFQRRGWSRGWAVALLVILVSGIAITQVSRDPNAGSPVAAGADRWSPAATEALLARGHPVFVYFTADWCLTCKANEVAAIGRSEVRKAFGDRNVEVLVGDWTNGDPEITRFLESRGRAGVPLYLWYEPGKPAEELPQVLTPAMLTSRARRAR